MRRCRLIADGVRNLYGRQEKSIGQLKQRGTLQSFTMEFKPHSTPLRPTTKDNLITA
jgi:hypothetical protein